MSFNKEEIFALSPEEKIALAEALWSSVEEDLLPVSSEEMKFADERLQMHNTNPQDVLTVDDLKKYFSNKYGL